MMDDDAQDIPEVEALNLMQFGGEPDLVDAAVTRMASILPEWVPRAGNTEMVLLESMAVMLGPLIMSLQIAPTVMVESYMALQGVLRDDGRKATLTLDLIVSPTAQEKIIPSGTRFRIDVDGSGNTVDVLTTDTVIIAAEDTRGYVPAEAELPGIDLNGLPDSTPVAAVDALPFVESIITSDEVTPGADPEEDESFLARASAHMARQNSTLVNPLNFQYAVAGQLDVGRALVLNNYNPATPSVEAAGHVTVVATNVVGNPLLEVRTNELKTWLAAQALASLTIHVIPPTYTHVDLAVTVRKSASAEASDVEIAVEEALRGAVGFRTWDWSNTLTGYRLVSLLSQVTGVVEVITVPADINLPGDAPMPIVDNVTVTVI